MAKELTPEAQIEALTKTVEAQKQQLSKQASDLADKVEHIRALDAEAEANQAIIAGYEAKLRAAQLQAEGGAPVVEHAGDHYRVVVPQFHYEGKLVTAESLATDASLVAKLIELGSGVLEKVASNDEA